MIRIALGLIAAAATLLAVVDISMAQTDPEFRLGFRLLADQIPDVVGQPLENERHDPITGDSVQRTTTGLMVWRKADNRTAFTDGTRSWVAGPMGIQERSNGERFDWETETHPLAASPAPTAAATPTPQPTPVPALNIRTLSMNVAPGADLYTGTVWIMGEIRNEGSTPVFNLILTGKLLSESGSVAGAGTTNIAYLGPGEMVGYRVDVRNPTSYTRAEISVAGAGSSYASYARLTVDGNPLQKTSRDYAGDNFEYRATVTNNTGKTVTAGSIYVWFLDEYDNVAWTEFAVTNPMPPGGSYEFAVATIRHKHNERVASINQVRVCAVGMQ